MGLSFRRRYSSLLRARQPRIQSNTKYPTNKAATSPTINSTIPPLVSNMAGADDCNPLPGNSFIDTLAGVQPTLLRAVFCASY
jgi:hypothetical protein